MAFGAFLRQPPRASPDPMPAAAVEVKRKEEVPANPPVYPFNGMGYQPSQALAFPYFPPASAAPIPVFNNQPLVKIQNQVGQPGFDRSGLAWKPQFKYAVPEATTTTTTATTTRRTTTTTTTTPTTTTMTESREEEDNSTAVVEPVTAMLQQRTDSDVDFENSGQSIASLVIGLTFVAAFLSIALGLVAHTVVTKLKAARPKPGEKVFNIRVPLTRVIS